MAGRIRRWWTRLRSPSATVASGTLLVWGALIAAVGWGGFSSFLHYSNSLGFCISCHEMRDTVYAEYTKSPHFENSSGVRATCADCHVPQAFLPKMRRKMQATFNEVPKHLLGTIATPEKFEVKRLELAQHVWDAMKANDSRECRHCHDRTAMNLKSQKPRARGQHEDALTSGETCIDCHKGIAHKKPAMPDEEQPEDDFSL